MLHKTPASAGVTYSLHFIYDDLYNVLKNLTKIIKDMELFIKDNS